MDVGHSAMWHMSFRDQERMQKDETMGPSLEEGGSENITNDGAAHRENRVNKWTIFEK